MRTKTCFLIAGLLIEALVLQAQTALVRHAPTLNGTIDGSIHQMTAEAVTFNSGGVITGNLLVPGVPTVQLNGSPIFGGTTPGSGLATPTNYRVTLNSGARLGRLHTRTDAIALPLVATPPTPIGTRSVSLNTPSQAPGDFATLRNLTLNSNVGPILVPAGVYGDFTANSGSGFTLGVAGGITPMAYAFQRLTINSNSQLNVIGPIIITVANAVIFNSSGGNSAHPEWLTLQIASGGLTLNSSVKLHGSVLAPNGTVTINSNSQLIGGVVSDRLTLNGNSLLRLIANNQPPTVALTSPITGTSCVAPASFMLAANATDPDGTIAKVEFYQGTTKLGETVAPPYQFPVSNLPGGTYAFKVRATDDAGASSDSAIVTLTVSSPNLPPTVSLLTPADGDFFTAPASFTLSATANDPDGVVSRVEFHQGTTTLGQIYAPPYQLGLSNVSVGTHEFKAMAIDNLGAASQSNVVTITVGQPNLPPITTLDAPASGTIFTSPASFLLAASATDPDGTVTKVEFFQDNVKLGENVSPPFQFNQFAVTGLGSGIYSYTSRAMDNLGATSTSPPVGVTVNDRPTVKLVAPVDGATFDLRPTIALEATATDSDGSVAKVEFYEGTTKLGESASAPYQFTWAEVPSGNYSLTAQAYDNRGATMSSVPHLISVQARLPFFTGFEATQNYHPGPIGGQADWTTTGPANVTNATALTGIHSLVLSPADPPASASRVFPSSLDQNVVFVDFFAKPAAATDVTNPFYEDDSTKIALVVAGRNAELYVYNADGEGGGFWQSTGNTVRIDSDGASTDWIRLTLREDFISHHCDLYLNGKIIAVDLGFADRSLTAFSRFTLRGHATAPVRVDDLFIGFDHPLFTDADKDGMGDEWEGMHGLNPALNDRNEDLDQDGMTNLFEYLLGTNPNDADTDGDGISDAVEMTFGYDPNRAQVGVSPQSDDDGDGLTLAQELLLGTNPFIPDSLEDRDTDGDGLPDLWEVVHGLNHREAESVDMMNSDADGDGLTLIKEGLAGTDPNNPDTDGDGMRDDYEVFHGFNPLLDDGALDADGDGLSNLQEFQQGSDPTDYYNGLEPEIVPFIGGEGALGSSNALAVRVTNKLGTPLINAPVVFEQEEGESLISLIPGGPPVGKTAEVRTGPGGIARVYLTAP